MFHNFNRPKSASAWPGCIASEWILNFSTGQGVSCDKREVAAQEVRALVVTGGNHVGQPGGPGLGSRGSSAPGGSPASPLKSRFLASASSIYHKIFPLLSVGLWTALELLASHCPRLVSWRASALSMLHGLDAFLAANGARCSCLMTPQSV